MDSCASCGAEVGESQAFCSACGDPGGDREVSLDTLLEPQNEDELVEDDDWDLSVPAGVPLRLVPLRDADPDDVEPVEHPDDFWFPAEVAGDAEPEPEPLAEDEPEDEADAVPVPPVALSSSLAPPPVPAGPALPVPPPLPMTAAAALAARVKSAETGVPLDEITLTEQEASQILPSADVDPWGVPISPVPLVDPSKPLFVDEAPAPDVVSRDLAYAALPRAGQLPYVPPRRSVPVGAVVAFVLSGVAASAAIGLLAVPVANADACNPDTNTASVSPSPSPAAPTPAGPDLDEVITELNAAAVALSAAETKATEAEQELAAARTALETATAATRTGDVDQSALAAAEAEVTRAASALQAAEAAQRTAASQAARHAGAGDWELDMLRAAEKERDQFSQLDPSDPYWDDEVAKAKKAYEQALVPQRQAATALTAANAALATARTKHATAVTARDQITGRTTQAAALAEERRTKAERKVARAEKAQATAQRTLVTARETRDELEASRRDLERATVTPPTGATTPDPAAVAACDTAQRERRTAAGVTGATSVALFATGLGLTARHRRR